MKKVFAIVLVLSLCLGLAACGNNTKAFAESKAAYEKINEAYEMVNRFSQDVYEAWNMGINDKSTIDGKKDSSSSYYYSSGYDDEASLKALADELYLTYDELTAAVAYLLGKDTYNPGSSSEMGDWYLLHSVGYSTSFFSACVDLVSTAYKLNGKADQIKSLLESAKNDMKQLGDKYSDYEHYPSLKKYFTNTTAFFGFCLEPEGSFNQVVDTFNAYRNNARSYYYDLNYVFEDVLFPEETTAETI
ncbi:MAG: hypothetical protein J6Q54_04595 [Oscillospiraceae bacterium]|nr:hypothetical protein [Oscillospiraceae bacterium]